MSHLLFARPPGFLERKNKPSLFSLNLDVYTNMDNRERASTRDRKQRIRISLKEQHENFFSGCEKMRNASGQQGEKYAAVKKKANRNTSSKMFCEQIRLRFLHKPYVRVLYVLLLALEKFYHDNHHPQVITPTDNFKYLKRSALFGWIRWSNIRVQCSTESEL